MEHPEPLRISLMHLQNMSTDEYLYMINNRNPVPLIEIAKEKSFRHLSYKDENDIWHIIITQNEQCDLKELMDV